MDQKKGSYQYIIENDEKIGMVYRSRENVNPIYISPGHKVNFDDTRDIIEQCLTRYKLPETTRQAHNAVNKLRKGELAEGYWENPAQDLFG